MIIHTENTAPKASSVFRYFFSHATGNMLHIGSRENAEKSSNKLIEIVVDADRYAQEIDVILDAALVKAQAAVKHIPKRTPTGAFDLPAVNNHLDALGIHLGLNLDDEATLRRIHGGSQAHTVHNRFDFHVYTYEGKSYRVIHANALKNSQGTAIHLENGNTYIVCMLAPSYAAEAMAS